MISVVPIFPLAYARYQPIVAGSTLNTNHYERDCRKKKRDQKNGTTIDKKNILTTTTFHGEIIIACDDACASLACQQTD